MVELSRNQWNIFQKWFIIARKRISGNCHHFFCVSGVVRGPDRSPSSGDRQEFQKQIPGQNTRGSEAQTFTVGSILFSEPLGDVWLTDAVLVTQKDLVDEVKHSPDGSSVAAWRKQLDHRLITGQTCFIPPQDCCLPSLLHSCFISRGRYRASSLHGGGRSGLQVSGQEQETKTAHDRGQKDCTQVSLACSNHLLKQVFSGANIFMRGWGQIRKTLEHWKKQNVNRNFIFVF